MKFKFKASGNIICWELDGKDLGNAISSDPSEDFSLPLYSEAPSTQETFV